MTIVEMRERLLIVRDSVTDPTMRAVTHLAASLVVSRLSPERRRWIVAMIRDMSYDCDCRNESNHADSLREVASAVEAD